MSPSLLQRLLPSIRSANWSTEKWRRHLLARAESQLERDDINATFRSE